MKKQYLESGKIVGTHGIKGEVRIEPWCDSPQFLAAFDKLYLDDRGETFIEVKSRPHKNITLCKIKGVDNIDDAQRLRGRIVYIDRDDVKLDEGVNFVQDLIGLAVIDADSGENYGKITDVLRTKPTTFTRSPRPTVKRSSYRLSTRSFLREKSTRALCSCAR